MINLTGFPDTQVFIYTCKNCGNVERIEYNADIEMENGSQIFTGWYRIEDGKKIYWNSDVKCSCGRNRKHGNLKVTVKANHVCDDSCKSAKGEKCVCSCGGKHHGIHHAHHSQISLFA